MARISMLMPAESQNVVAVMSAITACTPGASLAATCSPMAPAVAMSISGGKVTTVSGPIVAVAVSAMGVTSSGPEKDNALMTWPTSR